MNLTNRILPISLLAMYLLSSGCWSVSGTQYYSSSTTPDLVDTLITVRATSQTGFLKASEGRKEGARIRKSVNPIPGLEVPPHRLEAN
jgi:hypothetical protein